MAWRRSPGRRRPEDCRPRATFGWRGRCRTGIRASSRRWVLDQVKRKWRSRWGPCCPRGRPCGRSGPGGPARHGWSRASSSWSRTGRRLPGPASDRCGGPGSRERRAGRADPGRCRSLRDASVADMWFGRQLRGRLDRLSFEQTIDEGVTQVFRVGEAGARLIELTSATLLAAGPITEDLHAHTARLMNDPGFAFIDKALFGAWGRQTGLISFVQRTNPARMPVDQGQEGSTPGDGQPPCRGTAVACGWRPAAWAGSRSAVRRGGQARPGPERGARLRRLPDITSGAGYRRLPYVLLCRC